MSLQNILNFAHSLLKQTVQSDDHVIDGTVGNGHDTVLLAKLVGNKGIVYGFDIQAEAIEKTKQRLELDGLKERVTLFQQSHEHVENVLPRHSYGKIKAAIFNLGYLPGGNKEITTKATSTIAAVKAIFESLQRQGLIILVVYHGHEEGANEKEALLQFVQQLDQHEANVLKYEFINRKNHAPFIIAIEKR